MRGAVYLALIGVGVTAYPQNRSQAQELLDEFEETDQIYVEYDGQALAVESKYGLDDEVLYVVTIDGTGKIVSSEQVKERKLNTIAYEDDIEPLGLNLKSVAKITEKIPSINIELVNNVEYDGKIIIAVKRFELSDGNIYYLVTGSGGQELGYVNVEDVTEEVQDLQGYILDMQRETEPLQLEPETEDGPKDEAKPVIVEESKEESEEVNGDEPKDEAEAVTEEESKKETEEVTEDEPKEETEEVTEEESKEESEEVTEEESKEEAEEVTEDEPKEESEAVNEEESKEETEDESNEESEDSGDTEKIDVEITDFTEYNYQLVKLKDLEDQEVIHPDLDSTHVVKATNNAGNPYNFVLRGEGEADGVVYASLYKDGEFLGYINKELTEPKELPDDNFKTPLTLTEVSERFGIPIDKLLWMNSGVKDVNESLEKHAIQLEERKDVLYVDLLAEEGNLPDVNDTNKYTISITKKDQGL